MLDQRFDLMGTPIDFVDLDRAVETIVEAARERSFFQVVTVNLDFLVNSRRDQEVRTLFAASRLNLPDGDPVVRIGRLFGLQGISRIPGADLVLPLAAAAESEGLRIFLLGGEGGSAGDAARALLALHPGLSVSAHEPPRACLEEMDDASILDRIAEAEPHILLVAFGHPKQDKWIYRNRSSLPLVAMGVGCSLDLLAGRQTRAPRWMQRAGLEWSYRLLHDPKRLGRRYAMDGLWALRELLPWALSEKLGSVR